MTEIAAKNDVAFERDQKIAGSAAEVQNPGVGAGENIRDRFTVRARQRLSRLKESR